MITLTWIVLVPIFNTNHNKEHFSNLHDFGAFPSSCYYYIVVCFYYESQETNIISHFNSVPSINSKFGLFWPIFR